MTGVVEYPTVIAITRGEAEVGADRIVVRAGQAILAEAGDVIDLRPLTEPVETMSIEFWPSSPLPSDWSDADRSRPL